MMVYDMNEHILCTCLSTRAHTHTHTFDSLLYSDSIDGNSVVFLVAASFYFAAAAVLAARSMMCLSMSMSLDTHKGLGYLCVQRER